MFPQAPGDSLLHRKYFSHNETRIAIARGSAATRATSGHRFPNRHLKENPNWDLWYDDLLLDLQIFGGRTWDSQDYLDEVTVDVFVMDGVAYVDSVDINYQVFRVSSEPWRPHIQRVRDTAPDERFVEVLVKVRAAGFEILGEGVYCPITGTMHLVGCSRKLEIPREALTFEARVPYVWTFADDVLNLTDFESESSSWRCRKKVNPFGFSEYENSHSDFNSSWCENGVAYFTKSSGVCDMSVTLQYPPLSARWNSERVLNLAIRSTRREDDPLYFSPVERSVVFPYVHLREFSSMHSQATLETGGQMILLLLGVACIGLQIRHGRNNEEALPFVSLSMLGIQIANHVSQMAIYKDLQIYRFAGITDFMAPSMPDARGKNLFFDVDIESTDGFNYYVTMALHEYAPYQAMAVASIFMYGWIFHRVGDRRRIMQLRVRKGKPGANPPPSDRQLVFATLTILCIVGLFGIASYSVDHNIFRVSSIEGLPGASSGSNLQWMGGRDFGPATGPVYYIDPFVSPKFYELSREQWGFMNRMTGLVVSLFLVPQLLGNLRWEGQGRPLTAWFYVGLPFLQSLPQVFAIARHFQLLPIFSWYDPYRDSLYGFYDHPTPWWQMGVLLSSAILVVAVHLQFVTLFQPMGQHSTAGVSNDEQICDEL